MNLNGKNGINFPSPAENGRRDSNNGRDGAAGRTGSSAASFFGIGEEFVGDLMLSILAIGGDGGSGQDGGEGFRSTEQKSFSYDWWDLATVIGTSAAAMVTSTMVTLLTGGASISYTGPMVLGAITGLTGAAGKRIINPEYIELIGKNGNGGAPGLAGSHGDIRIIGFERSPQFLIDSHDGAMGKSGKGAGDGHDGLYPNQVVCSISATNITGQQMTETIEKYMEFAESEMANHIRQITLKKFIEKMQPEQQNGKNPDEL